MPSILTRLGWLPPACLMRVACLHPLTADLLVLVVVIGPHTLEVLL